MKSKIHRIQEQLNLMSNQFSVINRTEEHMVKLKMGVSLTKELLIKVEEELNCCINSFSVLKDGFEAVHDNISKVIES